MNILQIFATGQYNYDHSVEFQSWYFVSVWMLQANLLLL